MRRFRAGLLAATMASGLVAASAAQAGESGVLTSPRVPPDPTPDQVEQNVPDCQIACNRDPLFAPNCDPLTA